jgi:AcrR family transcriptional regulator
MNPERSLASMAPEPAPESRRERKKQRTRRQIYRAAMSLFGVGGFEKITIDQICEAADVARGTFFLHFPSKSALLFEFHRSISAEFAERRVEPRGSAAAELEDLLEMFAVRWLEQADVMQAMLRDFFVTPESVRAIAGQNRDLSDQIVEIVVRGQRRSEFRSDVDPRLAAALVLSTSAAILTGQVYGDDPVDPAAVRRELLAMLLGGLTGEA